MLGPVFVPDFATAQSAIDQFGSPLFLTDAATIRNRILAFRQAFPGDAGIFYALKANYNPEILNLLHHPGSGQSGVDGVDTVSPFEVQLALRQGFKAEQIIFTGNNSSTAELSELHNQGVLLNIGSLCELRRFGAIAPGAKISVRFNPGVGAGEFSGTTTGGAGSKFGIHPKDIAEVVRIIAQYRLELVGVHCHIGSGFYSSDDFAAAAREILQQCRGSGLRRLRFVDFGGGFGVRYRLSDPALDLKNFSDKVAPLIADFSDFNTVRPQIRVEPGKFLVAESSCLLVRVTCLKNEGQTLFVGTDSGFNHLIRPAFYGAYHQIVNLSRSAPQRVCKIVGNICESSDIFNSEAAVAEPEIGDILAIITCGAYGAAMSSLYNLRPYAAEVLLDAGRLRLTRRALDFTECFAGLGFVNA